MVAIFGRRRIGGLFWLIGTGAPVVTVPDATAFTLSLSAKSGAVGASLQLTATPVSGPWPASTVVTPSNTGLAGTWSPTSATPSGTTPVTFSFTPSSVAGNTGTLSATTSPAMTNNSGGSNYLISGGSTTGSTTLSIAPFDSLRVFGGRDATTGNPPGFTTTFGKGWKAITFQVTSANAVSGVVPMVRLRDNAAPNGTPLQDWIVIPGAPTSLAAGVNNITVNVPASTYTLLADIGLQGSLGSAASTPNPFRVGFTVFIVGQSRAAAWFSTYSYTGTPDLSALWTPSPNVSLLGTSAPGTTTLGAVGSTPWPQPNPGATGGYAGYHSSFAVTFDLLSSRLGVCVGGAGDTYLGGSIAHWDQDGPTAGWGALTQLLPHVGDFDTLIYLQGDADGNQTAQDHAAHLANLVSTLRAQVSKPFTFIAACLDKVQADVNGVGAFLTQDQEVARKVLPRTTGSIFNYPTTNNTTDGGHATMVSRWRSGPDFYRLIMEQISGAPPGPKVLSAARTGASTIRVTLANNGTSLVGNLFTETSTTTYTESVGAATGAQIAGLFSLYPAGQNADASRIALNGAVIVDATHVDLTSSAALPSGNLDLYAMCNITGSGGTVSVTLRDNQVDGDGVTVGRPMQRTLYPIYVSAATPNAAGITIAAIAGLSSGISVQAQTVTLASGTWSGAQPPSGIDLKLDSAAFSTAADARINNDGTWQATFIAPATGSHTLTAQLTGTTTTSLAVSFATVVSDLPVTGAHLDVDARALNTLFADTARSTAASEYGRVLGIADATGHSNNMQSANLGPRLHFDQRRGMPGLQFRSNNNNADPRYGGEPATTCAIQTVAAAPILNALWNASFSAFVVASYTDGNVNNSGYQPVFTAEGSSAETLDVGIRQGEGLDAERNNYTLSPSVLRINDTTDMTRKLLKGMVRFDVTTGTLKIMQVGGAGEITASQAVIYTSGSVWNRLALGLRWNYIPDSGKGDNFAGMIHKVVIYPGKLLSDTERDTMLAYGDRIWGPN